MAVVAIALIGCATPQTGPTGPATPTPEGPATPIAPTETSPGEESDGAYPSASDCPPFSPEVLPSGQEPGDALPYPEDEPVDFQRAWGEGRDRVVVGWGQEYLDVTGRPDHFWPSDWPPHWGDENIVVKEGVERYVVPTGDPPVGMISISFLVDECPYILWLPGETIENGEHQPGYTLEEAIDYAKKF